LQSYGGLKSEDVEKNSNFAFFWKNDPLWENFQNSVPKEFIETPIAVLFKFHEIWLTEIGKIVHTVHA